MNSRSIRNKLNQIKILIAILKPHVFCVTEVGRTESWIIDSDFEIEYNIDGYSSYRWSREGPSRGGGILVYISSEIKSTVNRIDYKSTAETILLKLTFQNAKPLY